MRLPKSLKKFIPASLIAHVVYYVCRCCSVPESSDSSQVPLYVIVITVGLMILLAVAMTLIAVVIIAFLRWRSRGKTEILNFEF